MDREDLVRTMRRHRICVLIPTYNNAATLRGVVDGVLKYADDVIVVNDGSTDATADILASFGDSIVTVSYGRNRGKGAALKHGFRRALELGYEYAVTIDSDGQHFPGDLPLFVRAIAETVAPSSSANATCRVSISTAKARLPTVSPTSGSISRPVSGFATPRPVIALIR